MPARMRGDRDLYDDRDRRDERLPEGDPLAIFHQLPAPQVESGELAAMKAAVAELRRARELARQSDEITGEFPPRLRSDVRRAAGRAPSPGKGARAWRLPAAAAALLAALTLFGVAGGPASGPEAAVALLPPAALTGGALPAALPLALPTMAPPATCRWSRISIRARPS